ncbi:MAG: hypothetical protein Q8Q60_03410 [Candidatus Chromulinivorax sp.]|nr:hypothetical protein [Candidatus Chromulinivorax sp.]
MKKYFSLLVLSAALFGAGCGNKRKAKAALEQKETVEQHFVQEEQATDTKEDYSVIA